MLSQAQSQKSSRRAVSLLSRLVCNNQVVIMTGLQQVFDLRAMPPLARRYRQL